MREASRSRAPGTRASSAGINGRNHTRERGGERVIPQEYIQEVVARNDITDVIGSYVQLRHRGRTHTGLCPFHSEKTPSFVVYPETQSYYCFGCGAGGDVITFIRTMNNLATWRRSSSWPPGRECPAGRGRQGRQTAQPHPGDQQAGRPLFLSVPERQQRAGPAPPGPTGGGADCPTAPSAGSGWAGRRMISAAPSTGCGNGASTKRSCWPPGWSSAAKKATCTTSSAAGS